MISYELRGLDQLLAGLRAIPAGVERDRKLLEARVELAAQPIADAMGAAAPRSARAGYHYAQRFRAQAVRPAQPQQVRVLIGPTGRRAFIGRFLEFGTWRSRARPHIRPTWDAKRSELAEAMRSIVGRLLADVGAKAGFKVKS